MCALKITPATRRVMNIGHFLKRVGGSLPRAKSHLMGRAFLAVEGIQCPRRRGVRGSCKRRSFQGRPRPCSIAQLEHDVRDHVRRLQARSCLGAGQFSTDARRCRLHRRSQWIIDPTLRLQVHCACGCGAEEGVSAKARCGARQSSPRREILGNVGQRERGQITRSCAR